MIAPLKQPPRSEPRPALRAPADATALIGGDRAVALLVGLLGFFCCIPYPAMPIGNASALQIGSVLSLLLAAPVAMMSWRARPFWILPALLAPLLISAAKVAATGDGDLPLAIKSVIPWTLCGLTLLIPQMYARRFLLPMLTGIAAATVLHAVIGLWQLYAFSNGVFPIPQLYVNQSFLSVQENATTIAKYTRRPFGLFPEPSAMSSSLAPWVLLFAAYFCGVIRLNKTPSRAQRALFATATVGGLGLIILSQSGHAAVTLAALMLFAAAWFVRCRATLSTYVTLVVGAGVVLPVVVYFAAVSLGSRVGGGDMGNSSWEERSTSLRLGFALLTSGDFAQALFGMGPGASSPALWAAAQIEAVYSVVLTYLYETGLVGFFACCWITQYLLRTAKRARFNLAYLAILFVWFVGLTVTTSYSQLLSLWLTLGLLSVWPEVCSQETATNVVNAPSRFTTRARPESIGTPGYPIAPEARINRGITQ